MSEYMEAHTVSKLIGSPPGYVGHESEGQLTEQVRRHPYSIILFDEIEKAHKDVYNMLLQILDDGRLTDSKGRTIDFSNCLIILTSNAGTSLKKAGLGFNINEDEEKKDKIMSAVKQLFRPEFLNRIDEIIVFSNLNFDEQGQILELMLADVKTQCKAHGLDLKLDKKAKEYILKLGYSEEYGARPMRRTIEKELEDLLAEAYLRSEFVGKKQIKITLADNKQRLSMELK